MIGLVECGVAVVSEAGDGGMVEGLWLGWEADDKVSWRRELDGMMRGMAIWFRGRVG